jgi:alanyl aminopeptidase
VKRGDRAFSNTASLRETAEPDGMTAFHFARTEPLPAELVAFAVGPFDVFEGAPAGHGTPIRVITPKGHAEDGRAAAQATVAVLPRLEAYTGIPYAFGKLDHVAVPDSEFAAVENPGLITYLARELLVAPGAETPQNTRSIRDLQAHELTHQWFGNLVTQGNWEDVWLSEGVATWLESKIMDQELPPASRNLAAIAARERIMAVDASARSRPVRVAVNNRSGSRNIYDRMVYQKGAAVLLMLEGWLGEDRIQSSLRAYLKAHEFANGATADLAAAIRDSAGTDPAPVLRSYLDRTGIPTVHADVRCGPNAHPRLALEQSGSGNPRSIPVCWRAQGSANGSCAVLDSQRREVAIEGAACPAWIYLNAGGTGYYRTAWSSAQLIALESRIEQLTPAERLTLVYDLRLLKSPKRPEVTALIARLESDSQPEIARAASEALRPADAK